MIEVLAHAKLKKHKSIHQNITSIKVLKMKYKIPYKVAVGIIVLSISAYLFNRNFSTNENYFKQFKKEIDLNKNFEKGAITLQPLMRLGPYENLIDPTQIRIANNYLFALTRRSNKFIYIIDLNDGNIISEIGEYGRGPNEFESAWDIILNPQNPNAFFVYDSDLFRISNYEISKKQKVNFVETYEIPSKVGYIMDLTWTNDKFVCTGLFKEHRIAFWNPLNNDLRESGELPPGYNSIPTQVKQHAYQGYIDSNPATGEIVLATRHSDKIEIYNSIGEPQTLIKGYINFEPIYDIKYRNGNPSMTSGDDLRFGYIDIATTREKIFALYSGRKRGQGHANYGNYVLEFNWDGALLATYKIEHSAISIDVNKEGSILYTIESFLEKPITIYKL